MASQISNLPNNLSMFASVTSLKQGLSDSRAFPEPTKPDAAASAGRVHGARPGTASPVHHHRVVLPLRTVLVGSGARPTMLAPPARLLGVPCSGSSAGRWVNSRALDD